MTIQALSRDAVEFNPIPANEIDEEPIGLPLSDLSKAYFDKWSQSLGWHSR